MQKYYIYSVTFNFKFTRCCFRTNRVWNSTRIRPSIFLRCFIKDYGQRVFSFFWAKFKMLAVNFQFSAVFIPEREMCSNIVNITLFLLTLGKENVIFFFTFFVTWSNNKNKTFRYFGNMSILQWFVYFT